MFLRRMRISALYIFGTSSNKEFGKEPDEKTTYKYLCHSGIG
jgi:hypothetical protein